MKVKKLRIMIERKFYSKPQNLILHLLFINYTMKTIEDLEQRLFTHAIKLLSNLHPYTKPLWGQMDAQRMVEHLLLGLRISNGAIDLTIFNEDEARALKMKKISLLNDRPMPKGFQNPVMPAEPMPYQTKDLQAAINLLIENLQAFKQYFAQAGVDATRIHNLFGPLTYYEWLWFHQKHFSHHFSQFGLINEGSLL